MKYFLILTVVKFVYCSKTGADSSTTSLTGPPFVLSNGTQQGTTKILFPDVEYPLPSSWHNDPFYYDSKGAIFENFNDDVKESFGIVTKNTIKTSSKSTASTKSIQSVNRNNATSTEYQEQTINKNETITNTQDLDTNNNHTEEQVDIDDVYIVYGILDENNSSLSNLDLYSENSNIDNDKDTNQTSQGTNNTDCGSSIDKNIEKILNMLTEESENQMHAPECLLNDTAIVINAIHENDTFDLKEQTDFEFPSVSTPDNKLLPLELLADGVDGQQFDFDLINSKETLILSDPACAGICEIEDNQKEINNTITSI